MAQYRIAAPTQLPALLKAIRRGRGLTQRQVASRMGLTPQAVSELERQASTATFERVMRYCSLLGVEIVLQDAAAPSTVEW